MSRTDAIVERAHRATAAKGELSSVASGLEALARGVRTLPIADLEHTLPDLLADLEQLGVRLHALLPGHEPALVELQPLPDPTPTPRRKRG